MKYKLIIVWPLYHIGIFSYYKIHTKEHVYNTLEECIVAKRAAERCNYLEVSECIEVDDESSK